MNEGTAIPEEIRKVWYQNKPTWPDRDYKKTVLPRIEALKGRKGFSVQHYGQADYGDGVVHPLMRVLVGDFDPQKPTVILTTTHGYEKGGPLGLLGFLEEEAAAYMGHYNIAVYPCLAPGPYEKNLRYTLNRIDTNRDALEDGKTQEMAAFVSSILALRQKLYGDDLSKKFAAAIDLHETPPEDWDIDRETATYLGEVYKHYDIPNGYYALTSAKGEALVRDILASVARGGVPTIMGDKILGSEADNGIVFRDRLPAGVQGTTQQFMEQFSDASVTTELCFSNPLSDKERSEPQLEAIRATFAHLDMQMVA